MWPQSSSTDRINSFGALISTWCASVKAIGKDPEQARAEIETAIEELRAAQDELRQQNEELISAQSLLDEERERYRDLFELAPDGYVVTDERGAIAEANRAASRLLGISAEFLVGKPLLRLIHADDVRTARHQMTLSQQTQAAAEWTARLLPRASASFVAGITVTPILKRTDNGRSCIGFRWLIRDVSDRIRAEMNARGLAAELEEFRVRHAAAVQVERADAAIERAARQHAEADVRAKDAYLALIAHELRNPLAPVIVAIDKMLAGGNFDPAECRDKLQMMQRNLAAERRLIDDLLDVTRVIHGKMELRREIMPLHNLISEVVIEAREALAAREITFHMELAEGSPTVLADPTRLRQIFWNILNNAIKFTPSQGRVILRTRPHPMRRDLIIEVADTGIGIAREALERLFKPFTQAESHFAGAQGGLGLGLSIVRSLVNAHGGSVTIDSQGLGKGAVVSVRLPLAGTVPPRTRNTRRADSASVQRQLKIGVVDDHTDSLSAMSELLAAWGHSVITASCVAEAVKVFGDHPVDLLIADLHLPDGEGTDILSRLGWAKVKRAVALTGAATATDKERCRRAGFEKILAKPVSMAELEQLLHSMP